MSIFNSTLNNKINFSRELLYKRKKIKSKEKNNNKENNSDNYLFLKLNYPRSSTERININSLSPEDNRKSEKSIQFNSLNSYNKENSKQNKYNFFSFYKLNLNTDERRIFSNKIMFQKILSEKDIKKEEKELKMKNNIFKKVNEFLFKRKIKKNVLKLNNNNNKNEMIKTFSYSNNSFRKEKHNECICVRKNLFPKSKKDNIFRKLKYSDDYTRNNSFLFKRYLKKQKEKKEKLLFNIRKNESLENIKINMSLALLKTKHKVNNCDKWLIYK